MTNVSPKSDLAKAWAGAADAFARLTVAMDKMAATRNPRPPRKRTPSEDAVEALAMFLLYRDWPSDREGRGSQQRRYDYRCMAAAILGGEAWAIKKAWPEGAYDIETMRSA